MDQGVDAVDIGATGKKTATTNGHRKTASFTRYYRNIIKH